MISRLHYGLRSLYLRPCLCNVRLLSSSKARRDATKPFTVETPKDATKPSAVETPKNGSKPSTAETRKNGIKPSTVEALKNGAKPSTVEALKNGAKPSTVEALKNGAKPPAVEVGKNGGQSSAAEIGKNGGKSSTGETRRRARRQSLDTSKDAKKPTTAENGKGHRPCNAGAKDASKCRSSIWPCAERKSKDATEPSTGETPKDANNSSTVEAGKNGSKQTPAEAGKNGSKQTPVEAAKNGSKQSPAEAAKNGSKPSPVEAGKDASKPSTVETRKNGGKLAAVGARKDVTKQAAVETGKEVQRQCSAGARDASKCKSSIWPCAERTRKVETEQSTEETPKDASISSPVETRKDASKESPVAARKDLSNQSPVEARKDPSNQSPVEARKDPSNQAPVETRKDASKPPSARTRKDDSKSASVDTYKDVSKESPVEARKDPSNQTPVEARKGPSRESPVEKRKDASNQSPIETRKDAIQASAAETSKDATPPSNVDVINAPDYKFHTGKVYSEFTCKRAEHIPEFNLTAYIFSHNKVDSQLLYIDRKDSNNVFSINFRTTPFDSTGLPHILEHIVLCGSAKYPVRDPFFKMLNRSVATFMNAMTGADYTLYPFSSMNETDYRNLQKIYLDAVFKPKLAYMDFLQEGWRLEHTNLKDRSSPYTIKGVVYNEMKGAFSENSSLFSQQLLNSILPDNTYGFVSGGNPLDIPKLSHKDLLAFHKKYYHPSNARFYAYGSFNLDKTLSYINGEYLSTYTKTETAFSKIPNHKRWTQPRNVHVSSRLDTMGAPIEKQNQIAIALLMADITNIYETFVLHVLSELLVSGPNSAFYKSMIEPNFSGGYNRVTGYEQHIKDTMFSLGLQDLRVDGFQRFQETFDKTIAEVISRGFDKTHVESILHNYELGIKHQTPKFGLGVLFNVTPMWNHEGDVIASLKVSEIIKKLRDSLKSDPKYLQSKMEQYFKNNQHRLTLTMSPDTNYEKKFSEAERKLLDEKVAKMQDEDRQTVYDSGLSLEQLQTAQPNSDALPILTLNDVRKPPEPYTLRPVDALAVQTQVTTVPTNQIAYLKCLFSTGSLSMEEIKLLPLFCHVVAEMGTRKHDYRTQDNLIRTNTSGLDFSVNFAENIDELCKFDLGVLLSVHALEQNTEKMFELILDLLSTFKMADKTRLKMLLENYVSNLSVGVVNNGHLYAMQSCAGLVTTAAQLKAQLTGLEHIDFMKNMLANQPPEEAMYKMVRLGKSLFYAEHMKCAINTSEDLLKPIMTRYDDFVKKLPKKEQEAEPEKEEKEKAVLDCTLLEPSSLHYVMNIPVNYCAKSFLTVPYTHEDHPTLRVIAKLISARYLLPVVREQNGAYGAGAKIGADGIFSFFSYRDPNSIKTLDAFDQTYKWLTENQKKLTSQALFEAKLGVLQQLDAPIAPGNKGLDNFLYGLSQQIFEKYRNRMLAVSLSEMQAAIEKYFKDPPKHWGKCVLGPINKELAQRKGEAWQVRCNDKNYTP